ncbi:chemotaxis protein CheA [Marinomonas sp. RS-M-Aa-14]
MIGPVDTFKTEVLEHLASLEAVLLELEITPKNQELINTAFRSIHTIKGAGGMFGYHQLTSFTHHLETVLDQIRKGELSFNSDLIGVFLDVGDFIAGLLEDTDFSEAQITASQIHLDKLYDKINSNDRPKVLDQSINTLEKNDSLSQSCFQISFKPDLNSFKSGLDIAPILRELHSFGPCYVETDISRLTEFEQFEPEECVLSWKVILITHEPLPSIEDTFMFVADDWQISIEAISSDELPNELKTHFVETPAKIHIETISSNKQDGCHSNNLENQKSIRNITTSEMNDPTIRVPSSRLDKLMNLVGELVIVQARLNQVAASEYNEDLLSIAEELDQLTTQMRDQTFSIRMLPIGTTFGKFRRLVRDLSKELNKQIELITIGGETELDKMVLDKLSDPLIHLIRNSIDHGIESSDVRLSEGKPATGSITLTARHADSHVVITIQDDGKGLDTKRIHELAIERHLITHDAELSTAEVHQLIFEPGFSTAKAISDISGRGVGMDVVKRSILELGGTISIHSKEGEGTEFSVRLPMTLAIIEGLMVKVGDEYYVLPLSNVEECIEMPANLRAHVRTRQIIEVRGEQIPFLILRDWFGVNAPKPMYEQIVITHIGEERFGFCVDEVVGQYQTVIKRLGKLYQGAEGFSGATILGDGSVAMILDPAALLEAAGRDYSSKQIHLKIAK